jgi:Flp pilus assembly protein TadD
MALVLWTFVRDRHAALAASTAHRLVHEFPEDSAAWANYGEYLAKLGRQTRAVRAFERAGRLAGTSARRRAQVGYCLHRAGRKDEAAEQLYLALLLDPSDGEIREMFHEAALAENPRLRAATWPPREVTDPSAADHAR